MFDFLLRFQKYIAGFTVFWDCWAKGVNHSGNFLKTPTPFGVKHPCEGVHGNYQPCPVFVWLLWRRGVIFPAGILGFFPAGILGVFPAGILEVFPAGISGFSLLELWVLFPAAEGVGLLFHVGSAPALLPQGPGSFLLSF